MFRFYIYIVVERVKIKIEYVDSVCISLPNVILAHSDILHLDF